jgi:DNA end-binding protein Ku
MGSRSKNSPRIRRKKPQTKDGAERAASKGQSRAIWTGTISFGLVNIPVALRSATNPDELDLDLLDRRDFSPVRYRRVNAKTGQEVPWNQIIKGYKHDRGQYIALSDADFQRANVEATRTIDIVDFVDKSEISPIYFDKPYYLAPLKNGQRAYALLRDVMKKAGKIGIAKIVIRTRQHLAALLTEADLLILNVLRFQHELRDPASIEAPAAQRGTSAEREIAIAEQLLNTMSGEWRPEKYHDEYRDDLLKLIQEKIDRGQTKSVEPAAKPGRTKSPGKVVDIMHLLRQSVDLKRKDNKDRQQKRKAG